ncbi:MAG: MarR family transcriptional regulator [Comamonadaceae bacterium]|nr:MAG: MarR family transcriptional regulator [Comamonadaceae bacterium]
MPPATDRIRETFLPLMSQITRQWRRMLDDALKPLGLTQATWLALLSISRAEEPMRQKDLAAGLGLDNSSVVRLLDNLQVAGYVERAEHADRRAKTIQLTPMGQEVVLQVEAVVQQSRRRYLGDIPPAELGLAHSVLARLSDALAAGKPGA